MTAIASLIEEDIKKKVPNNHQIIYQLYFNIKIKEMEYLFVIKIIIISH